MDSSMERAGSPSPLQQVKRALPELNGAMQRVGEHVLANPDEVARGSITKLAEAAQTSAATVTRLSTHLGYAGYPALRAALAMEVGRGLEAGWASDIGMAIGPADPPEQVLNVLASTQANALRNALAAIDLTAATRVADAIAGAGRTHIYGEWGDAIPARELYIRLLRIGIPVGFFDGPQSSQIGAGLLGEGDVALTVTRSGTDATTLDFLRRAREEGALTVAITGMPDAPIGRIADVTLDTGTPNGANWTEFFAGRASDVLTAGLLFVLVAQRVPDHLTAHHPNGPGQPVVQPDT
ncbi:MurR/RpiR family transcriptional regulator [Kribbella sindirgiensis]|uniref:MurR/RpiR family transcriptional regulator n=1 Tax=Kribbella sindirgiensis TaxID=1124744 RepID=A0A4R0J6S6_9ACTN|nr:MurR/RpiR family transcriptional regulator [Kribbella sindirgiensis]TCC37065.1 MurR/RpiR family transcriptional regulator [Kribbella sindirgiensis]